MQPAVVVVVDEASDGPFELPRVVVFLQLHHVFHRPVIPLDLALRHRMIRRAARVPQAVRLKIGGELDVMYAKAPYTVIQRAVHIHPTVAELIPTMLGDLKPLD